MNPGSQERSHSSGHFFDELRRRHVVRTALGYAAVVFVVLQLAEIILPAFGTGVQADAIIRVLVVGAVLLLPVVLAAAWVWEITPRGIRSMAELDAEAGIELGGSLAHRGAFLAVTAAAVAGAGIWWWQTDDALHAAGDATGDTSATPAFVAATEDDQGPIGSLAVLPLDDLSPGGAEEDYFVLGMHEALLSELSRISGLRVVSRTSVVQLSQEGKSVPQIGQELGVDAIVEGSVLRDGERVRITVQLIHAPSDTHLWAENYERDLTDIITLQGEVARAITAEIQAQVESRLDNQLGERVQMADADPGATRPAPAPTTRATAEVQEAVMRGRVMLLDRDWSLESTRAPDGMASLDHQAALSEAEGSFRRALEMDSAFVPALSGLAGALLIQGVESGAEGRTQVEAAEEFATRALELDPGSEEAAELVEGIRTAMAELEGLGMDSVLVLPATALGKEIQRSLAEREIQRSLAEAQSQRSRPGAGTLEPGEDTHRVRGMLRLLAAGRVEQAVDVGEDLLDEGIEDPLLYEAVEQGYRISGALDEVPDVVELRDGQEVAGELEELIDLAGVDGYWTWKIRRLEEDRSSGRRVSPVVEATARMVTGDSQGGIEGLKLALQQRDPLLALVRHDATWDPIRATPAFQETIQIGRSQLRWVPPRPPGG
jgi:TolB-like protein